MISKHDYAFEVTTDKLRLYKKLSPEERFLWLEEAHEFVINAVSTNNLTLWKQYAKGGYEDGKGKIKY